jgi:RND family efflux transporter MFP subunit
MTEPTRSGSADLEKLRISSDGRRRKKRRRRWPFVVGALVLLVVAISALTRPMSVRVAPVRAGGGGPAEAGGPILTANGYVEARHTASVAARTTGRLASVLVEEGDRLEEGQVVAQLLDEDQRAALAQAEANLSLARARLEQARANEADAARRANRRAELVKAELVSPEEEQASATQSAIAAADRLAAEAGVGVARAAVDAARLELEKTRVTAPFAGVVLRKDAEVGEIVGPIMTSNTARAGAVVTIADLKTLEAGVDVNEFYIARIAVGTPTDVVLDAHPEVHFPGEIRTIYPSADRDRATIPVRIRFLVEDERIRPDLGLKVTFLEKRTTDQIVTVPRVLKIPASAVVKRNGDTFAWIVREGKLDLVAVSVGEVEGAEAPVISGLNEGDQVVREVSSRLRKGMRAKAVAE